MLDVRLLLLLNPWLTVEMYLIQICFITLQDFIWTGRIVSFLISWDRVTNFNIFLLFLVTPGFFKLALSESLLKEIKPREPWEILSLKHKIITKMHWKFHSPMEKSQTFSFEKKLEIRFTPPIKISIQWGLMIIYWSLDSWFGYWPSTGWSLVLWFFKFHELYLFFSCTRKILEKQCLNLNVLKIFLEFLFTASWKKYCFFLQLCNLEI